MSYLFSGLSSEDRVSLLELEITRLQELCRKNFVMIDEMRKESKKLQEVHTELKETTSDLAYSLASVQCPWWQNDLQSACQVLASFAQKIQYILELPTFIDPIEQLKENGRFGNQRVTNILKSNRSRNNNKSPAYVKKCQKCKKKFRKVSSFERHSRLAGHGGIKKLKCRFCREAFQSIIAHRIHLKTCHSFPEKSMENDDLHQKQLSIAEFLKKNHVRVWRFIKCQVCDTVCSSGASLKNHQKYCRTLARQESSTANVINPESALKSLESAQTTHSNEKKKKELSPKNGQYLENTSQLIDLSSRPHLLVRTLHEDTSETEFESQKVSTEGNDRTLPSNGQAQKSTWSQGSTTATTVVCSTENNENVTTDPTAEVDIEPMTVAEAPVRLSSMHAFSINTSTATPSTSSTVASTTEAIPKRTIPSPSKSSSVGNNHETELDEEVDTSRKSRQPSGMMSTQDVTNGSKMSPTMCFLPSSSSSWESDKDQPSPTSSHGQVGEGGLLVTHKFTCSHRNCTRSFFTRGKLFHHEKTHTEIGESRSFSCQLCTKVFKDKYRLKTHFFTHCSDNSQKLMYRCLECGVFHNSLKDLARHNEVDHLESKLKGARYQCQSCSFCTNFRCKLDLHRKSSQQCRVGGRVNSSKGASGGDSSRVGGYTVFRQ